MPSMPRISVTRRKDNPEAVMSIGDHLRELRNRLVISALGILIGAVVGYVIYKPVYNLITLPITQANANGGDLKVNFPTILSSFDLRLRMSLWTGVLLSRPRWTVPSPPTATRASGPPSQSRAPWR